MPTPMPTTAPIRAPATHLSMVGEQTIAGALLLVLGWTLDTFQVHMDSTVQAALIFLALVATQHLASLVRNKTSVRAVAAVSLAVLFVVGCVHFDAAGYKELATTEIVALRSASSDQPLSRDRCEALAKGAAALRDTEGGSSSLRLPFFAGSHIGDLASSQDRSAAVCRELAGRDGTRGVAPDLRTRNRTAWERVWSNGRALLGGAEEE